MEDHIIHINSISTPLEEVIYGVVKDHIALCQFHDSNILKTWMRKFSDELNFKIIEKKTTLHKKVITQFSEYFSGKRSTFDLPVRLYGSDFQKKVWAIIKQIPFGKLYTYQKLALEFGNTKAIRAVAHANGVNPVNLIIPCHRVIGSSGDLTGYAGKIWRKQKLLELENGISQTTLF